MKKVVAVCMVILLTMVEGLSMAEYKTKASLVAMSDGTSVETQLSEVANVWQRKGNIFGSTEEGFEPSVIWDTDPVIFTSENAVFKMWYRKNTGLGNTLEYAESKDGISYTIYGSHVLTLGAEARLGQPFVFKKMDGDYALYLNNRPSNDVAVYTSPDGISWTLVSATSLTLGTGGEWDTSMGNFYVWQEGVSDWRMIYEGKNASTGYLLGYATSTDGIAWTKQNSGQPIIVSNYGGGPDVHKIGGTYYMWFHAGYLPTDVYRAKSSDLISWEIERCNPVFFREKVDEGAYNVEGQISDPTLIEHNGKTYMYYEAVENQTEAGHHGLRVAVANMTLTDLVKTAENYKGLPINAPSNALACRLYNTVTQTIPNNAYSTVSYNSVDYDTAGLKKSSDNTGLYAPSDGIYLIVGEIRFNNDSTSGVRQARIFLFPSNSVPGNVRVNAASGSYTALEVTAIVQLKANDYISMQAYQDSGADITLTADTMLSVAKLL